MDRDTELTFVAWPKKHRTLNFQVYTAAPQQVTGTVKKRPSPTMHKKNKKKPHQTPFAVVKKIWRAVYQA